MKLSSANINVILKACRKAAKPLIRDFGEIENLQVSLKGPGDFVTSADKRTEKIIIDELLFNTNMNNIKEYKSNLSKNLNLCNGNFYLNWASKIDRTYFDDFCKKIN